MGNVRFVGCLHLGDDSLVKKIRGFDSSEEHDEHLIEQWNSVVSKRDKVFILGDITMESPNHYHKLSRLKGSKHVILGNHDLAKDVPKLLEYVDTVSGMVLYKGFWLTHAPVHPQELNFVRGNIHAHIHHMKIAPSKIEVNYWDEIKTIESESNKGYYNVDAHMIDYKPKTINELLNIK